MHDDTPPLAIVDSVTERSYLSVPIPIRFFGKGLMRLKEILHDLA